MSIGWVGTTRKTLCALALTAVSALPLAAHAQTFGNPKGYMPIAPSMTDKRLVMNGHDMTIDDVINVARYGEKVDYAPAARQRMADNYGLLLEATAEGVSVYWFTRGAGGGREIHIFDGSAMEPANKAMLEKRMMDTFRRGADSADDPEILDEALVRAVMVVRANAMTYNAPSPALAQMLIDLLNNDITPVMRSRGSVGEGDLAILGNIGGTMVGAGEAYYHGVRMPASEALQKAGLKPLQPFAADDNALTSSNAYATAMAAFAVYDGKHALAWADLNYAIDLNGMNSSVTPLNYVVQTDRPFKWLNWDANRVKEMIRGSYLFGDDKGRIIQDPETLRASSIREASAWQAWATLKDDVTTQLNSSDHNPAIRVDVSPNDSWDLNTPEMLKYYVKGGPLSNGKHGFIFSNANWDPYPMSNDLESFTIAIANMAITIWQRDERFSSEFFTGAGSQAVLAKLGANGFGAGYSTHEVYQDLVAQINPVPPEGYVGGGGVEELEAQDHLKAVRANQAVEDLFRMLSQDIAVGAKWLDVRKAQDPSRQFGPGPTAAWQAYRKMVPLSGPPTAPGPARLASEYFIRNTPAWTFFPLEEPK